MATSNISVYLENTDTNKIYTVSVTADEAKRIAIDPVFARLKLNEAMCLCHDNSDVTDREASDNVAGNDIPRSAEEAAEAFKWPHEAILLLIEEYRLRQNDFNTGKISQKKIWSLIAQELLKHGHNVTGPQCLSKFSGLKRTYKAVKDHNNKSGNSTRAWPYLNLMDELLGTKPFMSPVATVSSTGKRSRGQSECSTSSIENFSETNENPKPKKARSVLPAEELLAELRHTSERRHRENMELRLRLLDSLDRMVNVLQNNK